MASEPFDAVLAELDTFISLYGWPKEIRKFADRLSAAHSAEIADLVSDLDETRANVLAEFNAREAAERDARRLRAVVAAKIHDWRNTYGSIAETIHNEHCADELEAAIATTEQADE